MANLHAVQMEAARSLVDMARHAIWTKADSVFGHPMAVEVRDETCQAVGPARTGECLVRWPNLHMFTFVHLARN